MYVNGQKKSSLLCRPAALFLFLGASFLYSPSSPFDTGTLSLKRALSFFLLLLPFLLFHATEAESKKPEENGTGNKNTHKACSRYVTAAGGGNDTGMGPK